MAGATNLQAGKRYIALKIFVATAYKNLKCLSIFQDDADPTRQIRKHFSLITSSEEYFYKVIGCIYAFFMWPISTPYKKSWSYFDTQYCFLQASTTPISARNGIYASKWPRNNGLPNGEV